MKYRAMKPSASNASSRRDKATRTLRETTVRRVLPLSRTMKNKAAPRLTSMPSMTARMSRLSMSTPGPALGLERAESKA